MWSPMKIKLAPQTPPPKYWLAYIAYLDRLDLMNGQSLYHTILGRDIVYLKMEPDQ